VAIWLVKWFELLIIIIIPGCHILDEWVAGLKIKFSAFKKCYFFDHFAPYPHALNNEQQSRQV